MNYSSISDFGSNAYSPINNPLTYCVNNTMDQRFLHGGHSDILGQHSRPCQLFMSEYCADKWYAFCEIASHNKSKSYPNNIENCTDSGNISYRDITAGDTLIYNTASRKYLVKMLNAYKKYEPFDPTVPTSPMISYWVSNNCSNAISGVSEYAVDPDKIDDDIVMDKILMNPIIAMNILINIYNTMKRYGTLSKLKTTKLGRFYNTHPYFKAKGGLSS